MDQPKNGTTDQKNGDFGFGVVLGFLSCLSLVAIIGLWAVYYLPDPTDKEPTNWIYRYQTLLTGIGAIAIGVISVWALRQQIVVSANVAERQIQSGLDLADQSRKKRLRAASALLPKALSDLSSYATACIDYLWPLSNQRVNGYVRKSDGVVSFADSGFDERNMDVPQLSDTAVVLFREVIECTDDQKLSEKLEMILRDYQVQQSRLNSLVRDHNRGTVAIYYVHELLIDALELHAHASSLFVFARRESEEAPEVSLDVSTMQSSANVHFIRAENFPDLHETLIRRYSETTD